MLYIAVFVCAVVGTYFIRSVFRKKELLDHPNDRSSHTIATPKGGGLAIMITFYGAITFLFFQENIDSRLFYALLSGVPLILISLVDDIVPQPPKLRFGIQLLSALGALYALGGVQTLEFISFSLSGIWVNILALLGIIWMSNLYNFLDGIDGYAGSEALFVGVAVFLLFGNEVSLMLALSTAGFLLFNWDKATIFMGDVGSAPLGFIFAIFILYDAPTPNFVAWLILLSLFWFDATLTLIRRARRGEKLSQAHKKHAYQRLHQAGFSHAKVVMLSVGVNLLFLTALYLLPFAYWLYLFLALLVLLYTLTKLIDMQKAFD